MASNKRIRINKFSHSFPFSRPEMFFHEWTKVLASFVGTKNVKKKKRKITHTQKRIQRKSKERPKISFKKNGRSFLSLQKEWKNNHFSNIKC